MLADDLEYFSKKDLDKILSELAEVERMLKALIRSLEKSIQPLEPSNPRTL
jgi:hypothetical protein